MPYDPHAWDDEDETPGAGEQGPRFKDFDCPVCNANNPYDDGFVAGDEVRCFYCGQDFAVGLGSGGRLRLKEI
ncbi:MAG TPA: hypothetical protein VMG32_14890 [Anaeromyxobacteraceae bacterium]|nr:hypothetical protein [Anaeromyxobacteraceae bacterium]